MEILPGIHVIPKMRWAKSYLIVDDSLTLIDSGLPWSVRGILAYIRSIGRSPSDLGTILVTHGHPDHVGSAASLRRRTGAVIVAHRSDTKPVSGGERALAYRGTLGRVRSPTPLGSPAVASRLVEDGDLIDVGTTLRVIHTPGHTAGSVCFLLEESGVLFSGDTVFSDGVRLSRSVPFPGYDRDSYVRSLERLSSIEFDAVCGGHGEPLLSGGSTSLRQLLSDSPDPPTWRGFFRSLPRRLAGSLPLTGEHQ